MQPGSGTMVQAHPGAEGWLEEGAPPVLAWDQENRVACERGVWVVWGELPEVLRASPVMLTRLTDSRSAPAAASALVRPSLPGWGCV